MPSAGRSVDDDLMGRNRSAGRDEATDEWQGQSSVTTFNPWLVVGFAVVTFGIAVGALVLVVFGGDDGDSEPAEEAVPIGSVATSSTTVVAAPTSTTTTTVAPPPTPAPTTTTVPRPTTTVPPGGSDGPYISEADALLRLADLVETDRPRADALVGVWVPQISSKRPGADVPNDDRGAYSVADVLADHLGYQERYAAEGVDVVVLRSEDFNFKVPGYLVTVADVVFETAEQANAWCDARRIGPDDCFAKRLSHDAAWQGSVLSRG
jgi:serine/threonine-protein kinase